jgi:hypothetical protein
LIPDLKAMTIAIDNHVNLHIGQIKKSNISKQQIMLAADEIEDALAKEVLKELCRDLPLDFKRSHSRESKWNEI